MFWYCQAQDREQKSAHPAKKHGFTKQKHIRGDKTLNKYNFGPNVVYYLWTTDR